MSDLPKSIREINNLSEAEKIKIYSKLLPEWLFVDHDINPDTLNGGNGHQAIEFKFAEGTRSLEITVKPDHQMIDPLLYLNMADTFNNQIIVLLLVINDLNSPRYDTDVDTDGNKTKFGTASRNIPAELNAMKNGLAPGQVRKGLRSFKHIVPVFEKFIQSMGHDIYFIEPLAYHNAISFEKHGFNYMRGLSEMYSIHQEFQPDGDLYLKLDSDNPFRSINAWQSVRGRSWAIHDGILGKPFTGFQMYKRIYLDANINTFPNARW